MKALLNKKLLFFIIPIIMSFAFTEFVNAQYICICGLRNYGCNTTYKKRRDILHCEATCRPVCTFILLKTVKVNEASLSSSFSKVSQLVPFLFTLPQSEKNSTNMFDITGESVKTIVDSKMQQAIYQVEWEAIDVNENALNSVAEF